jgi:WD40 repeat protein
MRSGFWRGGLAALAVVLTAAVGVLVNVLTGGGLRWPVVALAVVAVAALAALEWYRAATRGRRRFRAPSLSTEGLVDRPELLGRVVDLLAGDAPAGTVVLHGPPGFGKSTLASLASADRAIRKRYGRQIYQVRLRQGLAGPDLAARVLDLAVLIEGGQRPGIENPEAAGQYLGNLLDDGTRRLLVIDDVWSPAQLEPFLLGKGSCARLVTTRLASLSPAGAALVPVHGLTAREARAVLGAGLAPLPRAAADTLLGTAGGMALVLALANRFLRVAVAAGAALPDEATRLAQRVTEHGVRELDADGPAADRAGSTWATIELSIGLLPDGGRDRFFDLGVFAEDAVLPVPLVTGFWLASGGLAGPAAERLVRVMADVGLIVLDPADGTVQIHDVIRSHARDRLGDRLSAAHGHLVEAIAARLPEAGAWWTLPDGDTYLWQELPRHLLAAGRTEELAALVTDLRWVAGKLRLLGLAAVVADLGLVDSAVHGTGRAAALRRVLDQSAILLGTTSPEHAMRHVLLSRVQDHPQWSDQVRAMQAAASEPHLVAGWPLPDAADPCLRRTFRAHGHQISGIVIGPDSTWLATVGREGRAESIRVWDAGTGARRQVTACDGYVEKMVLAPGGAFAATGDVDGRVGIWNTATWDREELVEAHRGGVRALAACDTAVVSIDHDGDEVCLWDVATGTLHRHAPEPGGINSVAVADSWYATGHRDGDVRVWDRDGTLLSWAELDHPVDFLAATPRGDQLLAVTTDGQVHRWTTGNWAHSSWNSICRPDHAAVAPDGTWIVSPVEDQYLKDSIGVGTAAGDTYLRGHSSPVQALAIAPDGTWLASGDDSGEVRLWDRPDATHQAHPPKAERVTYQLAFAPDSSWLVVTAPAGARVYDVASGKVRHVLPIGDIRVLATAVAPDGSWLVTGRDDGVVQRWDPATGALLDQTAVSDAVHAVAVFPDGARIVITGKGGGNVYTWSPPDARPREFSRTDAPDRRRVDGVAISADGRLVACADNMGAVHLLDGASGDPVDLLPNRSGQPVFAVDFAPGGEWLAAGGSDHDVVIWDTDLGLPARVLEGHHSLIGGLAVAPSGQWLATCDNAGVIRIWDTVSWDCVTLMDTYGYLHKCRWSADSRLLAVTSDVGVFLFEFRNPRGTPAAR